MKSLTLHPNGICGNLRKDTSTPAEVGDAWHVGESIGDGLDYRFPPGTLAESRYLTSHMLVDGNRLVVFVLRLHEEKSEKVFTMSFGMLSQCSAQVCIPLEAVDQHRWMYPREGAWLKPLSGGDVVDLKKVDRMTLTVLRKSDEPARWCMTPFQATAEKPALLAHPILPRGPLLDETGQSSLHDWPQKIRGNDEVTARLKSQLETTENDGWPAEFSRWGGWTKKRFQATGFFRTEHDGKRWWLVDPDGCVFWSAGLDCVRYHVETNYEGLKTALAWLPPESGEYAEARSRKGSVNFLAANFIRAFGAEKARDAWKKITLGLMRRWRFNTVANWSDWEAAREAGFPYVRPMEPNWKEAPTIFRDFPDVFHPGFAEDLKSYAAQLRDTRDDPALIGYFLMNEPTWGFAAQTPAEGMWLTGHKSLTHTKFVEFLKQRHGGDPQPQDFIDFSALISEKLFAGLSAACRAVDPNHLNLGARYYTAPPDWAVAGMRNFDVFSINCYQERVWPEWVEKIANNMQRPVLVGEWHFGALDAGLPASGIGHVRNQVERGRAYRFYVENAAALPGCVGVHWFTLYDQSAIGRFDGENYNVGFLDVCNQPYEALAESARIAHERMYRIAGGELQPSTDAPEYLPLLFM